MMKKQVRHSATCKAQVVLEMLKEEKTVMPNERRLRWKTLVDYSGILRSRRRRFIKQTQE